MSAKSSESQTRSSLPHVSILVAAWNEEFHIAEFLANFSSLTYSSKELILCAGGTDDTYQIAQARLDCNMTLVAQQAGEGKYRALQRSLERASGTIIYLTDVDCIVDDASFQRLIFPIIDGAETVVTGRCRPLSSQLHLPFVTAQWAMEQGKQIQAEMQNSNLPTYVSYLVGANCALARPTIETAWQNTHKIQIGEDYYLALQILQMGQRILFQPESSIQTQYPTTAWQYIVRKSRWYRSWLLHHYHLRFQMLLALPLLSFFGWLGLAIWIIIWACCFSRYRRCGKLFNATSQEEVVALQSSLLLLMVADFCAWAIVPLQVAIPKWRERW